MVVDCSTATRTVEPGRQMSTRGAFDTSPVHDVWLRHTPFWTCTQDTGAAMVMCSLRLSRLVPEEALFPGLRDVPTEYKMIIDVILSQLSYQSVCANLRHVAWKSVTS